MKGKTSSGFEYELDEAALDDYELLEDLCEMDAGNVAKMSQHAESSDWYRTEGALKRTFADREWKGSDVENDESKSEEIFKNAKAGKNS